MSISFYVSIVLLIYHAFYLSGVRIYWAITEKKTKKLNYRLYLFFCLPIFLPIYCSIHLSRKKKKNHHHHSITSISLSLYLLLPICLSIFVSICVSKYIHLFIFVAISLHTYLFICLSFYPCLYLSHLFVYLSAGLCLIWVHGNETEK